MNWEILTASANWRLFVGIPLIYLAVQIREQTKNDGNRRCTLSLNSGEI